MQKLKKIKLLIKEKLIMWRKPKSVLRRRLSLATTFVAFSERFAWRIFEIRNPFFQVTISEEVKQIFILTFHLLCPFEPTRPDQRKSDYYLLLEHGINEGKVNFLAYDIRQALFIIFVLRGYFHLASEVEANSRDLCILEIKNSERDENLHGGAVKLENGTENICAGEEALLSRKIKSLTKDSSYSPNLEKILMGNDIALIGPAPIDEDDKNRLRKFKYIAQIGFLEVAQDLNLKADNLKIIGYYNNFLLRKIDVGLVKPNFARLNHARVKSGSYKFLRNEELFNKLSILPTLTTGFGTANLGSLAVVDLISHGANSVYVTGLDLHLSLNPYRLSYKEKNGYTSKKRMRLGAAGHDYVAQYRLLRALAGDHRVRVNTRLEEILSYGEEKYTAQYSLLYGRS